MHPYIPTTEEQRQQMLEDIGASGIEELFASVPEDVRLRKELDIPDGMSEMDVARKLKSLAAKNANIENCTCFLGAGAYDHYIPAVVDSMLSRQEFYTAYTPYQPEISQGTLQAVFEYQSMICSLTGMDVSNASMYDGASALAEAAVMACGVKRRKEVVVAGSVHPESRAALRTYARFRGIEVTEFGFKDGAVDLDDLASAVSDETAAVILQSPNFFGIVEDLEMAASAAHSKGALLIASCDPVSLALLKSPGESGADIAVGEGQPLGNALSYGGPYLGYFAVKEALMRRMPGRIAGQTVDKNGKRCYVLTMQAREQHIRREKATSNICSNEALCALAAAVYLGAMGPQGLKEAAEQCAKKAVYTYDGLIKTGNFSPVFSKPFFREFAVKYDGDVKRLNERLLESDIIGGYDLGRDYPELEGTWLVAVTEKRTKTEIDEFVRKAVKV